MKRNANHTNHSKAFIAMLCVICVICVPYQVYICTLFFSSLFSVEQRIAKRLQGLLLVALADEEGNVVIATAE